jgi:TetR/AcrR family transcriptional repressor of nem operon
MPKPNNRQQILDAALAVFQENGFNATSVNDIVERANVPKGSFYNHFKSKDALGIEILDIYWDENSLSRTKLLNPNIPAFERLSEYLGSVGYSDCGCLIGNFSGEVANLELFRNKLSTLINTWKVHIASCIKDGQQEGTITAESTAEHLAEYVVSCLQGSVLTAKVSKDTSLMKRNGNLVMQFLGAR